MPRSIHRLEARITMNANTAPVDARSWRNSFVLTGMMPTKERWMPSTHDQQRDDGRSTAVRQHRRAGVPLHLAAEAQREHHDPGAGQHDRRVEHVAGEHRERAQAAEVEVPPQRVGGRHDRDQQADGEEGGGGEADLGRGAVPQEREQTGARRTGARGRTSSGASARRATAAVWPFVRRERQRSRPAGTPGAAAYPPDRRCCSGNGAPSQQALLGLRVSFPRKPRRIRRLGSAIRAVRSLPGSG